MTKRLVMGGSGVGKTTLAHSFPEPVYSTDDLLGGSEPLRHLLDTISSWFDLPNDYTIEGTLVAPALRRYYSYHKATLPFTEVYYLTQPQREQTPSQLRLNKWIDKECTSVLRYPKIRRLLCTLPSSSSGS